MSTHFWQRPMALVVAAVAVTAGTAGAAQLTHGVDDRPAPCARDANRGGDGGDGGFSFAGLFGGAGAAGGDTGAPGRQDEPGDRGSGPGAGPGLPGKTGASGCARSGNLPDKTEDGLSVIDKTRIVALTVTGQVRESEVAEKYRIPESRVTEWKRQMLTGDWLGLLLPDVLSGS
ncbi:hypothetical protein [Streptomyces sp. NPDC026673]|uniref:hypothetical protein n=1 Tax=Streptomyces sp. NPDC026673 TaxID=3155724 RepID=UPI0033D7A48D